LQKQWLNNGIKKGVLLWAAVKKGKKVKASEIYLH